CRGPDNAAIIDAVVQHNVSPGATHEPTFPPAPNVDQRHARHRVSDVSPALPDLHRHCGAAASAHGDAPVSGTAAVFAGAAGLHGAPTRDCARPEPVRYLSLRAAAALLCTDHRAEHRSVPAGL